jgi:hypothetical protein
MERENVITATQKRLKQYNLGELNHYKETTQEQFMTIEEYFLKTEERINKAIEEINSINFNIRGICNEINISKSTIYNNPNTLRLFLEKRIEEIENQDIFSKNKAVKTQERMSDLEKFLDNAIIDQIEFNNLKLHNDYLQNEVRLLTEKKELLTLERIHLVNKINEMESELRRLRNKKGNVVKITREDT